MEHVTVAQWNMDSVEPSKCLYFIEDKHTDTNFYYTEKTFLHEKNRFNYKARQF